MGASGVVRWFLWFTLLKPNDEQRRFEHRFVARRWSTPAAAGGVR
jgi:hypothetical protein